MPKPTNRPLEVLPGVQLSPEQMDRLAAIEQYDLWFVIERLVDKRTVAPHLIDQAVLEFRKYMALVAMGYDNLGMHSREIDEVWHAFILFTREYSDFCNHTCGQMIHHTPNTSRRPELPAPSVPAFKEAYKKYFGALPEIWGTHSLVQNQCDAAGEEPDVDVSAGDCDAVDDPPDMSGKPGDCNADGMDSCRASLFMHTSKSHFVSQ